MLPFIYFIIGLVLGMLVLYVLARPKPSGSQELGQLKAENTFLKEQKEAWQKEKTALLQELDKGREQEQESREQALRLRTEKESFAKEMASEQKKYEEKIQDQQRYFEKELSAQKSHYEELSEKQKKLAEKAKIEFENIAQKIFEQNSKIHREESQRNLSQLLSPLKENISHFSRSVSGFEEQKKSFQETIAGFKIINQEMRDANRQFTQALKGDTRAQGHWGEFVLESILEKSGLRKGQDWISQGRGMDMKGGEGDLLRPDVIVHLPEGKHIVIDAKVSLTSYQKFCSAEKEEEKKKHLSDLESSLSRHIERLSSKKYHKELKSPDFTLMFIPYEGGFSLLTEFRQGLFDKAWKQSIAIVSPTTLFANLKTIASLWKIEQYNRNATEIAREGGRLYDKFVGFLESMAQIDKGLKIAQNSYEKAKSQLTGHGSLIRKTENLKALQDKPIVQGIESIKQLGASTGDKNIPSSFSPD